jgi:hypothetical protein
MAEALRRISTGGGVFTLSDGTSTASLDAVIVNAANISRAYYKDEYDAANPVAPTCWSADTDRPDSEVSTEDVQSSRCMDCTQNIRGSGSGMGRACRFLQRVAVLLEDDLNTVYQLQVSATSIFGKPQRGCMPLQQYAKHLSNHNTRFATVLTNIYFDVDSPVPKLFFKPKRSLNVEEVRDVEGMVCHPETLDAINTAILSTRIAPKSPFFDESDL